MSGIVTLMLRVVTGLYRFSSYLLHLLCWYNSSSLMTFFLRHSRGALLCSLFKLLVDKLDAKTFENTKLLQDYISSFRLDRIPGENISMGSSCFKAAAKMLSRSDMLTDLLQL